MRKSTKILLLLYLSTSLLSCYSLYYGSTKKKNHTNTKKLTIINGTGHDLKWYTKEYIDTLTYNGYLWFIEGSTFSSSGLSNIRIDSVDYLGVKYDNPSDTLFDSTFTSQLLDSSNWKIIIGDQDYEKKLVLLSSFDTLTISEISYDLPYVESKICCFHKYSTNHENLNYHIFFNESDQIIAEGPVTPDYIVAQKKPKRRFRNAMVGVWKFYEDSKVIKVDTFEFNNVENLMLIDKFNNNR